MRQLWIWRWHDYAPPEDEEHRAGLHPLITGRPFLLLSQNPSAAEVSNAIRGFHYGRDFDYEINEDDVVIFENGYIVGYYRRARIAPTRFQLPRVSRLLSAGRGRVLTEADIGPSERQRLMADIRRYRSAGPLTPRGIEPVEDPSGARVSSEDFQHAIDNPQDDGMAGLKK